MDRDKIAIAAHLYIAMRREAKRTIDVEWLLKNTDYAREIIALARQYSPELATYSDRLAALLPEEAPPQPTPSSAPHQQSDISDRYIGHLR